MNACQALSSDTTIAAEILRLHQIGSLAVAVTVLVAMITLALWIKAYWPRWEKHKAAARRRSRDLRGLGVLVLAVEWFLGCVLYLAVTETLAAWIAPTLWILENAR